MSPRVSTVKLGSALVHTRSFGAEGCVCEWGSCGVVVGVAVGCRLGFVRPGHASICVPMLQKKGLIAESFYIQGRELLEILNKPPGSRTVGTVASP